MRLNDRVRAAMAAHGMDEFPVWTFYVTNLSFAASASVALLQRGWPPAVLSVVAAVIVYLPTTLILLAGDRLPMGEMVSRIAVIAHALVGAGLFLVHPVSTDFAPLIVVVAVGELAATSSAKFSLVALALGITEFAVAGAMGHLEAAWFYGVAIQFSWVMGYIMRTQSVRLTAELDAQTARAQSAALDERSRIAREVHDVIAHSLSVTMLHLTAARRALEQDRDVDEAIDALTDAERLGRQAMSDIRRTVGILGAGGQAELQPPEPSLADIDDLVHEVRRAGIDVSYRVEGDPANVSATTGLGLYRITQESLANVVKHAPGAKVDATLEIGAGAVGLMVCNDLPHGALPADGQGSGLRGMRERAQLLGGEFDAGPDENGWTVRAAFPIDADVTNWRELLSTRFCPRAFINRVIP